MNRDLFSRITTLIVIGFIVGFTIIMGALFSISLLNIDNSYNQIHFFPSLHGSAFLISGFITITLPLSFLTAVYFCFYSESEIYRFFMRLVLRILSKTPVVVFTLVFIAILQYKNTPSFVILIVSTTLYPVITIKFINRLEQIEKEVIEQSLALGASKEFMIFKIILPLYFHKMMEPINHLVLQSIGIVIPVIYFLELSTISDGIKPNKTTTLSTDLFLALQNREYFNYALLITSLFVLFHLFSSIILVKWVKKS
ncbi:ABC transporter permease subunit [bacterium]|nr:ABC transporter permease subunit [bacterium]